MLTSAERQRAYRTRKALGASGSRDVPARRTHCLNGHEYTPETTLVGIEHGRPGRACSLCREGANARSRERRPHNPIDPATCGICGLVCTSRHARGLHQRAEHPRGPLAMADRFWPKVDKSGACWEWQGTRGQRGYGRITNAPGKEPRTLAAHRVSWELTNGPIPDALWVLHHCDNPPCVNPSHLFLGTAEDNMRDAVLKGRHVSGFAIDAAQDRRKGVVTMASLRGPRRVGRYAGRHV